VDAIEDTDAQARQIQRDLERTREEMDQTLTALEHRLAPSEILHQGAETVRERVRSHAANAVETLKRHPAPVALAAVLLGTRLAFRPSAADRQRRQAQEDVERAWSLLGAAFEKAKEHSQLGTAKLEQLGRDAMNDPGAYAGVALRAFETLARVTADRTWRTMQRATVESRAVGQALRREAETRPLGALMLLGLGIGMAMLGTRGVRASR
jgi:hypothetical protein